MWAMMEKFRMWSSIARVYQKMLKNKAFNPISQLALGRLAALQISRF
jgi:hypothetical protein